VANRLSMDAIGLAFQVPAPALQVGDIVSISTCFLNQSGTS